MFSQGACARVLRARVLLWKRRMTDGSVGKNGIHRSLGPRAESGITNRASGATVQRGEKRRHKALRCGEEGMRKKTSIVSSPPLSLAAGLNGSCVQFFKVTRALKYAPARTFRSAAASLTPRQTKKLVRRSCAYDSPCSTSTRLFKRADSDRRAGWREQLAFSVSV